LSILETLKAATSLEHLAAILGYKPSALAYIIYKLPDANKYKKFTIPKKGGGDREISAPIDRLKVLQRHLANTLYACRDHIDATNNRRSLSHGFRKPKIATIIGQIACYENALPQGSPCSPIIADLIAHVLDVRLAQLARKHRLTYSRYADDLTFSTGQMEFPAAIARPASGHGGEWQLGDDLVKAITRSGFAVNPTKTRMQFRMSRQLVTGLTVNSKVNIRPEYYRFARAMCDSLFETGSYYRPDAPDVPITSLGSVEGILAHIHHVKDRIDRREEKDKKKHETATAARKLYARFLAYRYFVGLERPLIICEGKTDNIYLKYAISKLPSFQPKLGAWEGKSFKSAVSFFNYHNKAKDILDIGGGVSDLKFFFIPSRFQKTIRQFAHKPLKFPIIVVVDNDKGGNEIFNTIKNNYQITVTTASTDKFFHIVYNLYLVKTPSEQDGTSCIEDLFPASWLQTELDGKKFNPNKGHDADGEYGKFVFAEKVVRPNADKIDFSAFSPLLERITAAMDHYRAPA
jgi:RNA-directed DNA polymerase